MSRISTASRGGERGAQPVERVGRPVRPAQAERPFAQAERVQNRVGHLGRLRHRGKLGEPGRAGEPLAVGQSPGRLRRQPGLAHAARSGERDQALSGELFQHADHLLVPADEAGRLIPGASTACGSGVNRSTVTGSGCGGRGGGGRDLLSEDGEVGLVELRRRVHAETVGKQVASPLVDGQGLGLAAGGGEGAHQQRGGALRERVGGGQLA